MSSHVYPSDSQLDRMRKEGACVVLFDSDIPCYSIGFAAKDDSSEHLVESSVDNFFHRIKYRLGATHYLAFLTDGASNFRVNDAHTAKYKGNRENSERPYWYPHIKQYVRDKWKGQLMVGIEADDALTIAAKFFQEQGIKVIIASLDKDLLQFPGLHYNWDRNTLIDVSYEKGQRNLWKQMIIGDVATDNIPGLSDSAWAPKVPFKIPVFDTIMRVPTNPPITKSGKPSQRKMAHPKLSHWETVTDPAKAKALAEMYYGEARALKMLDAVKVEEYPSMVLTEYVDAYWAEAEAQGDPDLYQRGINRFNEVFRLVYMLRTVDEIPNDAVISFTPLEFAAKNFDDFSEDDTDADDSDFDF